MPEHKEYDPFDHPEAQDVAEIMPATTDAIDKLADTCLTYADKAKAETDEDGMRRFDCATSDGYVSVILNEEDNEGLFAHVFKTEELPAGPSSDSENLMTTYQLFHDADGSTNVRKFIEIVTESEGDTNEDLVEAANKWASEQGLLEVSEKEVRDLINTMESSKLLEQE